MDPQIFTKICTVDANLPYKSSQNFIFCISCISLMINAYEKLLLNCMWLKHNMRIKFWLDLYGRFASRVLPLWYVYNILLSTYYLPIISSFSNIFCTKSANRVACQLVFLNWVSSMKLLLSLICNFWLFLSVLESSWSHQLLALRIWFEKKN